MSSQYPSQGPYSNQSGSYQGLQYPYQQPLPPQQGKPPKKRPSIGELWYSGPAGKCGVIGAGIIGLFILFTCIGIANIATHDSQAAATTHQPIAGSTKAPLSTPTPQPIHYPPKTVADLHGLAAQGDSSAIHTFDSESVGLTGACPQPKREVTVAPGVTGQQLAEDLLAYFYAQQLDNSCGSIIFAYHNQGEANDVYTAGRIKFDAIDSSGEENIDPNATNLKHVLTLDIGGAFANQEYVVTY
jgi:hypothetical protein